MQKIGSLLESFQLDGIFSIEFESEVHSVKGQLEYSPSSGLIVTLDWVGKNGPYFVDFPNIKAQFENEYGFIFDLRLFKGSQMKFEDGRSPICFEPRYALLSRNEKAISGPWSFAQIQTNLKSASFGWNLRELDDSQPLTTFLREQKQIFAKCLPQYPEISIWNRVSEHRVSDPVLRTQVCR